MLMLDKPRIDLTSTASGGEVAGFGDIADTTFGAMREVDNANSSRVAMEYAYDDRIDQIFQATGKRLENPERLDIRHRLAKSGSFGPLQGEAPDPHAEFQTQLNQMATEMPQFRDIIAPDRSIAEDAKARARAAEKKALDTWERGDKGVSAWTARLAGGFYGAAHDPINVVTLGLGPTKPAQAGIKGLLWMGLKQGAANAGAEAAIQPFVQNWRAQAGLDHGLGLAASNVALAAGFGLLADAGIRSGVRGIRRAVGRPYLGPDPLPPVDALDAAAKDAPADSILRRAADGDEQALRDIARDSGLENDPQIKHMLDELETERLFPVPERVDGGEHLSALARAVRESSGADELPVGDAVTPMTTREIHRIADEAVGEALSIEGKAVEFRSIDPREVAADPDTFQFKSGGNEDGVTDRLRGVTRWDPVSAGKAIVFERADGSMVIADGHQRRNLALRAKSQGQDARLDAYVFREADGWTPEDVRAYAALKNMRESSGNALDMAQVMRERPDLVDGSLPLSDGKLREATMLARLSPAAFDAVQAGRLQPAYAALIGESVVDASRHIGLLDELAEADLANSQQARLYLKQLLELPTTTEVQHTLFGEEAFTRTVVRERVKVLDAALKALRADKRIFGILEREASTIEGLGNILAREANQIKADKAAMLGELIERLATSRGMVATILNDAAASVARGYSPTLASRAFVARIADTLDKEGINGLLRADDRLEAELNPRPMEDPAGPEAKAQTEEVEALLQQESLFAIRAKRADLDLAETRNTANDYRAPLAPTDVPSAPLEALSDVLRRNAENLGQLFVSNALLVKGFRSLDVESRGMVVALMRDVLQDREIRDAVVRLVPVDVMDMLSGKEFTPNTLLDNPAVLVDLLPVNADDLIPSRIQAIDILAPYMALATAERPLIGAQSASLFQKALAARLADKGDLHIRSEVPYPNQSDQSLFGLRGFYSPAIRAAEGISQAKGTGEQFWKQITKVPGVRKDELDWMGLEEFLTGSTEQGIAGYHGSPLNFDRFDASKVGSGEGSLFAGYGHHFTADESMAKSFQSIAGGDGVMYKANLDVKEDELLDWDKIIADQPSLVEKLVPLAKSINPNLSDQRLLRWVQGRSGNVFYSELSRSLGSLRAASAALQNAGVPGLKYANHGGSTPSNFVIFDDALISITHKNGRSVERKFTKAEVVDFMRAHQVALDERVLGASQEIAGDVSNAPVTIDRLRQVMRMDEDELPDAYTDIQELALDGKRVYVASSAERQEGQINDWVFVEPGEAPLLAQNRAEAVHMAEGILRSGNDGETRFHGHKVPGGESYRELLIRLPQLEGKYTSKHFQDQEIVHLRVDDRTGPNGEKVLFINEVQSDLHQLGRQKGYQGGPEEAKAKQALDEITAATKADFQTWAKASTAADGAATSSPSWQRLQQDQQRARSALLEKRDSMARERGFRSFLEIEQEADAGRIVNAPFKGDLWLELALKRALLYASENGYDAVSWARSDQIAKAVGGNPEKLALQYDQKIGKFLDKYTRKWGGKVEEDGLRLDSIEDALEAIKRRVAGEVEQGNPLLRITPEMRASVMEEQPLSVPNAEALRPATLRSSTLSENAAAQMAEIRKEIDTAVSRALPVGWRAEVRERMVFGDLPEGLQRRNPGVPPSLEIEGTFDPYEKIIFVSMAALDPVERAYEEAGHALKALRLVPEADYDILRAKALEIDARTRFNIDERYGDVYGERWKDNPERLEAALEEEAIMQMVAARARGDDFGKPVNAIMDKIIKFFRAVRDMLGLKGFRTFDDVFEDMTGGGFAQQMERQISLRVGDETMEASATLIRSRETEQAKEFIRNKFYNDNDAGFEREYWYMRPNEFVEEAQRFGRETSVEYRLTQLDQGLGEIVERLRSGLSASDEPIFSLKPLAPPSQPDADFLQKAAIVSEAMFALGNDKSAKMPGGKAAKQIRELINGAAARGELSREDADALIKRYDSLERQHKSADKAKAQLSQEIDADAAHRKRQKALSEAARTRVEATLVRFRDARGQADPAKAMVAMIENLGQHELPEGTLSVANHQRAIFGIAMADLDGLLHEHRKTIITGQTRDKAGLRNVVRELFGQESGDQKAKAFATAASGVMEGLRQRHNAAGGAIGKRERWGLPQWHDPVAMIRGGKEAWINYIAPLLDVERMRHPLTGNPLTQGDLRNQLDWIFDNIVSDGWKEKEAKMAFQGLGSVANQRGDHRFLVFKDADSWMKYAEQFGAGGDPLAVIVNHIKGMSEDIAAMEVFGPNPRAMLTYMQQFVEQQAARRASKLPSVFPAVTEVTGRDFRPHGNRLVSRDPREYARRMIERSDNMWNIYRGASGAQVGDTIAEISQTVRNVNVATKLGSAFVSALGDPFWQLAARKFAGLPVTKTFTDMVKQVAAGGEREARRAGVIADTYLHMHNEAAREAAALSATKVSGFLAERVISLSMLGTLTRAGNHAMTMGIQSHLADQSGKAFRELAGPVQRLLRRHGLGEADWDAIRRSTNGDADFLTPVMIHNATGDQRLAERYLAMTVYEAQYATTTGTLRARAMSLGNTKAGTPIGEMWRHLIQFKSFAVNIAILQIERMAREFVSQGLWRGAQYGAFALASATLGGALVIQLKQLKDGKDPRDMTKPEFWGNAMYQSGGLSIWGDLLYASENRFGGGIAGTIAGPTASTVQDLLNLTYGAAKKNLIGTEKGETNFGRELTKAVRGYTPGSSLWYARLAWNRVLMDNLQRTLDPQAEAAFRRQIQKSKKDYKQEFWWKPGRPAPTRSPSLSAALPALN
jgi:hypothetical protein